jgi:MFS family permease
MYAIRMLGGFLLILPVIVPFFRSCGLNMAQILSLQAIFSLAVVALEIPSGYFADVLGRKKSIVVGAFFCLCGWIAYCLANSFYGFLTGEILMGIGCSCISGADSAMLYDSLFFLGQAGDFKKVSGRCGALGNFSEGTAGIIGGLLAVVSLRLPMYIETVFVACTVPVALTLTEPDLYKAKDRKASMKDILDTVGYCLHGNRELAWLILYSSTVGASTLTAVWFIQPWFAHIGLPLAWFGIAWAVLNYSVALFSWSAHRIEHFAGRRRTLLSMILFSAIGYACMAGFDALYAIGTILALYFIRGINGPITSDYINRMIGPERRATVLSVQALASRLLFSIIGPIAGWLADTYSLSASLSIIGLVYLLLGCVGLFYLDRHRAL